MTNRHQLIPIAGLLGTVAMAAYMTVHLSGQAAGAPAVAEVRDAGGQVLLSGQFAADADGDDDERTARLQPTGGDPDAAGQVEVELSSANAGERDIELSIRNVQGNSPYTLLIDGQELLTVSVGDSGRVKVELDEAEDD